MSHDCVGEISRDFDLVASVSEFLKSGRDRGIPVTSEPIVILPSHNWPGRGGVSHAAGPEAGREWKHPLPFRSVTELSPNRYRSLTSNIEPGTEMVKNCFIF